MDLALRHEHPETKLPAPGKENENLLRLWKTVIPGI